MCTQWPQPACRIGAKTTGRSPRGQFCSVKRQCHEIYKSKCDGHRVGNSLFGFSCESLFFYEQTSETAIHSFPRVISSRHSLKKSDGSKSDGSDLLLGIKMGKAGKTIKNMIKTTNLFEWNTCFWRAKERKCNLLSKNQRITHVTLC